MRVLQTITMTVRHRKLNKKELKAYRKHGWDRTGFSVDEAVVRGAGKPICVGVLSMDHPGAHMEVVRVWALRKLAEKFGVSVSVRKLVPKKGRPRTKPEITKASAR